MLKSIRQAWSRLKTILRPFARRESRRGTLGLLAVLVALLLVVTWLNVQNSYINNYFMTALSQGQVSQFWKMALVYGGVFGIVALVASCQRFVEEWLGLRLREELTLYIIGRYLADHTYHRLTGRVDIDNPDQRISEDIKTFTANSLSFALIVLNSAVNLISFAAVLWLITPRLVLAAVGYASFGTVASILLGKRLVPLNFLQLKKEADFRFRLIQVRENDEAIALQAAEPWESRRLGGRLRALVDNFKRIIGVDLRLNIFVNSFNYLTQIIPALVVAPLFFRGEVEFGAITQAIAAFAFVLNAFTVIVTQFQQIASLAAVAERLGSLIEAIEERPAVGPKVTLAEDGGRVAFDKLTLLTPHSERLLIKDLTLDLPPGRNLLVTGPDGAGKSALFLAAAGLWEWGEGRIVRPGPNDVFFLPQQPFLAPGTLRDQLTEGVGPQRAADAQVLAVLKELQFEKILGRVGGLDADKDWPNVLSPSERRLVAFARLLLSKPKVAFIDDVINGLTVSRVNLLYGALARTKTTYISIGDHSALREHHDMVLDLDGEGVWKVEPCKAAAGT